MKFTLDLKIDAQPHPLKARVGFYDCALEIGDKVFIRIDAEGRWCSMRREHQFFRRTIDSEVVLCASPMQSPIAHGARVVHDYAQHLASALYQIVDTQSIPLQLAGDNASRPALLQFLQKASQFSAERFAEERKLFTRTYPEPVMILPPDRYRDVVVSPMLGCPYRKCSFCAFYKNRPFRILSTAQFREHIQNVARLFGKVLSTRNGVFIGAANAMVLSQRRLLPVLETIRQVFPPLTRGIAAFWDPDHSPTRASRDWQELALGGITRVFVGLETGEPQLRASLGKASALDHLIRRILQQRQSNITTGITVLAGLGDEDVATRHRQATAAVLKALKLNRRDIVYISPLTGNRTQADLAREVELIRRYLRKRIQAQIAPYRMDMFRYYA